MVRHVISSAVLYSPPVHDADSILCCFRAPRLDIAQATIKQLPSYELHGVLGQTYNVFLSRSKTSDDSNANIIASSHVGAQMQIQNGSF